MSTSQVPIPTLTFEQRMLLAAQEASTVSNIFSPAVAQAIQAGISAEPVVGGFIKMLIDLFHHHAKLAAPPVPVPALAPAPTV